MKLLNFIRPNIRKMQAYVPGEQKNDPEILKLNSNENPFPPSPSVLEALRRALEEEALQKYPPPTSRKLRAGIARRYGCDPTQVLIGNGSDEILNLLFRAFLKPTSRLVIPDPTYSLYPILAAMIPSQVVTIPLTQDWHIDFETLLRESQTPNVADLTILAQPNAPTGLVENEEDLQEFIKACPGPVLIDEAYADFAGQSWTPRVGTPPFPNLMVSGTFSKSYSLAGLRVGWLIAPAELIQELDKIRDSYNVNRLSQAAALAALEDTTEFQRRISRISENREFFKKGLERLGFEVLDGRGNFLFTRPVKSDESSARTAKSCFEYLYSKKILVRYFPEERLSKWLRISIGTHEQMELLLAYLSDWQTSPDE